MNELEIKMTRLEARAVLFWIAESMMQYRPAGGYYRAFIRAIEKVENVAQKKLYLTRDGYIKSSKKTGNQILEEIIIESKSNPVPIRYSKIEQVWSKYWEQRDKKKLLDKVEGDNNRLHPKNQEAKP